MTPRIEVLIDEVVVRGMPPAEARALLASLEAGITERATAWLASGSTMGSRQEASRLVADVTTDDLAGAVWTAVTGGRS